MAFTRLICARKEGLSLLWILPKQDLSIQAFKGVNYPSSVIES
jgi:hypothetical protein